MKHVELFESFFEEDSTLRYTQSDLREAKEKGGDYQIFYPGKRGGHAFTIAGRNDIQLMRSMLDDRGFLAPYSVGFGPDYHNPGNRDPKSMVVIFFSTDNQLKKNQEILYDIIGRNFSLNYPH